MVRIYGILDFIFLVRSREKNVCLNIIISQYVGSTTRTLEAQIAATMHCSSYLYLHSSRRLHSDLWDVMYEMTSHIAQCYARCQKPCSVQSEMSEAHAQCNLRCRKPVLSAIWDVGSQCSVPCEMSEASTQCYLRCWKPVLSAMWDVRSPCSVLCEMSEASAQFYVRCQKPVLSSMWDVRSQCSVLCEMSEARAQCYVRCQKPVLSAMYYLKKKKQFLGGGYRFIFLSFYLLMTSFY